MDISFWYVFSTACFTIVVCVIKCNIPLGWPKWRGTRVCPGSAGTRRSAWSPWTPWQRAGSSEAVKQKVIYVWNVGKLHFLRNYRRTFQKDAFISHWKYEKMLFFYSKTILITEILQCSCVFVVYPGRRTACCPWCWWRAGWRGWSWAASCGGTTPATAPRPGQGDTGLQVTCWHSLRQVDTPGLPRQRGYHQQRPGHRRGGWTRLRHLVHHRSPQQRRCWSQGVASAA